MPTEESCSSQFAASKEVQCTTEQGGNVTWLNDACKSNIVMTEEGVHPVLAKWCRPKSRNKDGERLTSQEVSPLSPFLLWSGSVQVSASLPGLLLACGQTQVVQTLS